MWKELIQGITDAGVFNPPAEPEAISHAGIALGASLPTALIELLGETDGIEGEYGLGLIWPIHRIEADNISFRQNADFSELYMSFDHLLFFADAGNGDQFAFAIQNGKIRKDDVFVWNHEDDSRSWVAPSIQKYLEWWLTGKLKI